jgi:predicted transcriptional regulator
MQPNSEIRLQARGGKWLRGHGLYLSRPGSELLKGLPAEKLQVEEVRANLDQHRRTALVFAVKPVWSNMILNATKTVEFRRRGPGQDAVGKPFILYASAPVSALVGYGKVVECLRGSPSVLWERFGSQGGITRRDFQAYFVNAVLGEALVIERAATMSIVSLEFLRERYGWRPPMSWRWLSVSSPLLSLVPVQV